MSNNKNTEANVEMTSEELSEVLQVRRDKLANLQEMGRDPFKESRYDRTHYSVQVKEGFEALEGETVKIAGRMMSKRIQGKAGFIDIQDAEGRIQSYVRKDFYKIYWKWWKRIEIIKSGQVIKNDPLLLSLFFII